MGREGSFFFWGGGGFPVSIPSYVDHTALHRTSLQYIASRSKVKKCSEISIALHIFQ